MDAVVLGWDPDQGNRWTTSYDDCVRRCRDDHGLLERWPVGDWRLAPVGTRVHLMLQGRQRGLIGRGTVRSAPFLSADPTRPGQVIHHVLVEWDTLLPLDRRDPGGGPRGGRPGAALARLVRVCPRALPGRGPAAGPDLGRQRQHVPPGRLTRNALRLLRR